MAERAHIDRIEGDRAVLLVGADGRETVSIPARLLPPGAQEGTALDLTLSVAEGDTVRADINNLMDDLFGSSGS